MGKPRIMVVEDDYLVAVYIQKTLENQGYLVPWKICSGENALRIVDEEDRPDLVLMDIMLQGNMNGIEAAGQMRDRKIPVVFLTALTDQKLMDEAARMEPYGFLVKPLDPNELRATIMISLYRREHERRKEAVQEYFCEHQGETAGNLNYCTSCHKVSFEKNEWLELERYFEVKSGVNVVETIRPGCRLIPNP